MSVQSFTSSLVGSLFESLQAVACSTQPVPEPVEADDQKNRRNLAESVDQGADRDHAAQAKGRLVPGQGGEEESPGGGEDRSRTRSLGEDIRRRLDLRRGSDRIKNEPGPGGEPRADQKTNSADKADSAGPLNLSEAEQRQIQDLRRRDAEVRSHEQAHVSQAGGHAAGGPNYVYQTGPDGRQYAIGGSVNLDVSEVPGNPEATARKARAVRRAAMAPAQPSAQDLSVASKAQTMEAKAQTEAAEERREEEGARSVEAGPQVTQFSAPSMESAQPAERQGLGQGAPEASQPSDGYTLRRRAATAYEQVRRQTHPLHSFINWAA